MQHESPAKSDEPSSRRKSNAKSTTQTLMQNESSESDEPSSRKKSKCKEDDADADAERVFRIKRAELGGLVGRRSPSTISQDNVTERAEERITACRARLRRFRTEVYPG